MKETFRGLTIKLGADATELNECLKEVKRNVDAVAGSFDKLGEAVERAGFENIDKLTEALNGANSQERR